MKKKIRTLTSWILVSLMLQFSFYYFLNRQVENVMAPVSASPVIVENLEAEIPGTNLEGLQISYAKDYLAYKENGVLKVFNLKQNKVVFEKKPPAGSNKNMGVLYYQWLPDRDTLVYFYARKNPNPTTTVVVPVTPSKPAQEAPANQNTSNTQKQSNQTDPTSKSTGVKTQSVVSSNTTNPTDSVPGSKTQELEKVEDPNQSKKPTANPNTENTKPETRTEIRYNNPQITELFTLELPPSDEEESTPDDRYNRSIDSFPAGGEITQMVVSTFTNLMYLTIKNGTNPQLMEIDIMKNVRTLNRTGELISQMAVSDKFGTLYVKSKSGSVEQILALKDWGRDTVSKDPNDVILGDREGTLYIGKVQNGQLVNIRSTLDTSEEKTFDFKTLWEGSIPFKNSKGVIIGAKSEIVVYDDENAYIVQNGKEKEVNLSGEENYISPDGVELIQITRTGTSTKVKLQPLQ